MTQRCSKLIFSPGQRGEGSIRSPRQQRFPASSPSLEFPIGLAQNLERLDSNAIVWSKLMSTPLYAAEAQTARDYAAATNAGKNSTTAPTSTSTSTSTAASLARALSTAATAIAGDISLVAEGIEAVGDEQQQQKELRRPERASTTADGTEVGAGAAAAKKKAETKKTSSATRDQVSFLVSVLVFGMSAFYLGAFPVSFSRCYIFLACVLLGTRYFVYRSTKQHLFLLDLCYQVNALWVAHLIFFPRSLFLRRCLFALSSGPLMGSIGAFRNSLVFHDLDKMTSLFIHLWPAALAWQSRWHQAPAVAPTLAASAAERRLASALSWGSAVGGGKGGFGLDAAVEEGAKTTAGTTNSISCLGGYCLVPASSPAALAAKAVAAAAASSPPLPAGWNDATFAQLLFGAYVFYFLWAVPYALYMFVFAKERIRERQYETLYTYQTRNPNSPMSKMIKRFPPRFSALVYMGSHLLACSIALSTTYLWWRSYAAHSLALVAAVGVSAWHGASFLHYVLRRARREAAAEAAAAAYAAAAGGDKDD